jgi:uncharacterized protein (TIGR02001 family)
MLGRTAGLLSVLAAIVTGVSVAHAGEPVMSPAGTSAAQPVSPPRPGSRFDVAFGVGATTDYLARGVSQSSDEPAVQGFTEADYDRFYLGIWASNASRANQDDVELDVAAGWRPSAADFSFDFGYVQYIYVNNVMGPSFGEFYAGVTREIVKNLTVGTKVSFAPDYAGSGTTATYVEGQADLKLPHGFGISGAVGYQFFDSSYAANYLNGNIGIYWNVTPQVRLDLRASTTDLSRANCARIMSVGSECGTKILFGVSFSDLASNLTKQN